MAKGNKVVTFGEIMLKLQPEGFKRFLQAEKLEMSFGGGEANVAVSIANLGGNSAFLTKLPKNAIGDKCLSTLRGQGVDVNHIARGGERMGIYFAEKGASQRASKVIYDRAGASINTLDISELDLKTAFDGAGFFHYTGISPALSQKARKTTLAVIKAAKAAGLTICCDLNYRKNLWTTKEACNCMTEFTKLTDVLISNEEDCKDVFGINADGTDIDGGQISADGYAKLSKKVFKMFPNLKAVAFTLRESINASINGWSALFAEADGTISVAPRYTMNIVDRVGGGDSFAAGLIFGLTQGWDGKKTIDFATAASCLKHSIEGDFNLVSFDEVEALRKGNASGRVQR